MAGRRTEGYVIVFFLNIAQIVMYRRSCFFRVVGGGRARRRAAIDLLVSVVTGISLRPIGQRLVPATVVHHGL